MSCQFLANVLLFLCLKSIKAACFGHFLGPIILRLPVQIKICFFFLFQFVLCQFYCQSRHKNSQGEILSTTAVGKPTKETGWTPLSALRQPQLRDPGVSNKHQQKIRFLTISAFWISAYKVWWKERVSFRPLSIQIIRRKYLLSYFLQFSSVIQLCPTLCDPMNRSTPGLPVHHQLPEFTQTHVHQLSDAIQPSHPPSSPSPPAPNPSQHQSLFQ